MEILERHKILNDVPKPCRGGAFGNSPGLLGLLGDAEEAENLRIGHGFYKRYTAHLPKIMKEYERY